MRIGWIVFGILIGGVCAGVMFYLFPSQPGFASGVALAIGLTCGYNAGKPRRRNDW